jgi:hypothetical protein
MIKAKSLHILFHHFWWILLLSGCLGFLHIWFFFPHESSINGIVHIVYKIFIYIIICLGISCFPKKQSKSYILVILIFFVFLGFILPRLGYFGFYAIPQKGEAAWGEYYTLLFLILYPAIVLTASLSYRIGGGKAGKTFKIALGSQIILFSGYLDLMWHIINEVDYPEIFYNAHHIKVFIGHFPNLTEVIIFALCHIPLLVGIILLPLDRWIDSFKKRITA